MTDQYENPEGNNQPHNRNNQPYGQNVGGASPAQGGFPQQGGYPQQPYYGEPPKKKRGRGCLWMILGAVLLIVLVVVGLIALLGSAADKVDEDSKAKHTVHYKVTGHGPADLTFSTDTNGSVSQQNKASLPWAKTVDVNGWTGGMSIMAQNGIGSSGTITCEIDVDGKNVKQATATGEGAVANCSAP